MAVTSLDPSPARRAGVLENLFGSAQALKATEHELQKILRDRGVFFGEGLLPTYAYAYALPVERVARWAEQSELVISAAEYVAGQLVAEAMCGDTQSFTREVNDLIYTNPGYERTCVLVRPDGIPMGADLKFVELNCDSPAMMMFLDIVTECLMELDAFATLRGIKVDSAADRLLETLLDCYREYGGKQSPTIAIADWEGQKTRFEHQRLAEHFQARGHDTVVCDPRSFTLTDGNLHLPDGRRVHLVYRRALVSEIIDRRHDIVPLLRAYRDGTVCMVNPLRSYVASAKSLLTHLVEDNLPPELKAAAQFIPRTVLLDDPVMRRTVIDSPNGWALKKSEGHGGMNVVLPKVSSESSWRQAIESSNHEMWIAQEYLDVPRMALPIADGEAIGWTEKYYNWNPFVFGGRYAGGLVRVSTTPLINITLGGGLLPTLPI